MNKNIKFAFTLAETLITLGIIGVVAALTIPGLITAYKKHVISTSLKRTVSEINQAIKQSETENGEMETWDTSEGQLNYINKYIQPYIKIAQICDTARKCGYKTESNTWKNITNTPNGLYNAPTFSGRIPFITQDGILYVFAFRTDGYTESFDNNKLIIVDINGAKGPNIHGQDVFFLYRDEDKDSIIPYGAHTTGIEYTNCNGKDKSEVSGLYCAAWIYQNGWEIPSGYIIK